MGMFPFHPSSCLYLFSWAATHTCNRCLHSGIISEHVAYCASGYPASFVIIPNDAMNCYGASPAFAIWCLLCRLYAIPSWEIACTRDCAQAGRKSARVNGFRVGAHLCEHTCFQIIDGASFKTTDFELLRAMKRKQQIWHSWAISLGHNRGMQIETCGFPCRAQAHSKNRSCHHMWHATLRATPLDVQNRQGKSWQCKGHLDPKPNCVMILWCLFFYQSWPLGILLGA